MMSNVHDANNITQAVMAIGASYDSKHHELRLIRCLQYQSLPSATSRNMSLRLLRRAKLQ